LELTPVGTHCILELYGCDPAHLDDMHYIRDSLRCASREGMSTLLKLVSHRFEPYGVTALALLAESHISIHTWPEHGYAAVDIFTCGEHAQPKRACEFLVMRLGAQNHLLRVIERGRALPTTECHQPMMEDRRLCPAVN